MRSSRESGQSESSPPCRCMLITTKASVRRKRRRLSTSTTTATFLMFTHLIFFPRPTPIFVRGYEITWNNGPEDKFFCGFKWDDPDCSHRQNCRTGKHEECEGFAFGEKCFANTNCDTKYGGGHSFVPGMYDVTYSPTPVPTLNENAPTMASMTLRPTIIPTEVPIRPPDPLPMPSDDLTDHWFCGFGIDNANEHCAVHCPNANECPVGQICYFGTSCDARTFAPTPPPTRRPTNQPTPRPTSSPTSSMPPSTSPTETISPSAAPTKQGPTKFPTTSPTRRPVSFH